MEISNAKIGFIGFGNIGQAMADGFLKSGKICPSNIYVCANNFDKLKKNAEARGVNPCKSSDELVESCDVVFVAVKPWMVDSVMRPLRAALKGKIVVSLAAGVFFDAYEEVLGSEISHISCVPNTPISINEGILVVENKHNIDEESYNLVKSLFDLNGIVVSVDASKVDIASTIGGCGPAFAAMFMEALGDAGVRYGLSRPMAYELAAQMMAGTGKLYLDTRKHPGEMKDNVCSPGGTTIIGVSELEKHGMRNSLIEAIKAIMNS